MNSPNRLVVLKIDITSEASIKQAASEVEASLGGKRLDVGMCQYAFDGVKSMLFIQICCKIQHLSIHLGKSGGIITVNVLGVTRAFLSLLQKGTTEESCQYVRPNKLFDFLSNLIRESVRPPWDRLP